MIRKVTLLACYLAVTMTAGAAPVSPSAARQKAEQFFSSKGIMVPSSSRAPMRLAYKSGGKTPAYYVFNNGNNQGFVIVAGDDEAETILGYSDKGSFDYASAPEQVRCWLDDYASEIDWLRAQPSTAAKARQQTVTVTPVQPLLGEIAWDQTYPYNLLTPCYVGTTHAATGCVATAMAQIMYYHKYPAQGKGQHTYKPETLNQTLSVDFSQSHYGWDVMTPKYGANSTDTARMAVALLMRDCGVAVDMAYGQQSGSNIDKWLKPLTDNFGYDKGFGCLNRNYYTQQDWDDIIREEVVAGRPVFATGFTGNSGGHAFVFDGYDADGLIHVNWGWSGMSNGYIRTSALTPPLQGTGGSTSGFNYKQGIIVGIQPPVEGSEPWLQVVSMEHTKANADSVSTTSTAGIRLTGKIANMGWQDATIDLGFGVYDDKGNLVQTHVVKTGVSLPQNTFIIGLNAPAVSFSQLQPGHYVIRPIVRNAGGKRWFRVRDYSYTKSNALDLTLDHDYVHFHQPAAYQLEAHRMQSTKVYTGITSRVTATVVNRGEMEYSGVIHSALFDAQGTIVAQSGDYKYDISTGDSMQVAINNTFSVEPGSYSIGLIDENTTKLCTPQPVEVLATPAEQGLIEMARQLSFDDNAAVPADSVALTAHVKVTQGVFANDLTVYITDAKGNSVEGSFEPEFVFGEAGQVKDVDFHCSFENGVPGTTYKAQLINLSGLSYVDPVSLASCLFTLKGGVGTGISQHAVSQPQQSAVYTPDGRLVSRTGSIAGLRPGIYIRSGKKLIVK